MFIFPSRDMPSTHTDAMRLQAENLEQAAQSRVASRVTSIAPSLIASAIQSRRASRPMSGRASFNPSRRGSIAPHFLQIPVQAPPQSDPESSEGSPETLENLIRVTQNQESIIQTYYTNDNGEVVTLSLYDISSTDPADILGNDVIARHESYADEDYIDFNTLEDRLRDHQHQQMRRRSLQKSGDSYCSEP